MVNRLTESISAALLGEFGRGYKIYREEKQQGLEEPCFFIVCISPSNKRFFGKRYFRGNQFCIHYFPQDGLRRNQECHTVAERLFSCLEYLVMEGDKVMGTGMHYEVDGGILHFFVNYDMFVYRPETPAPMMGEMEIKGTAERRYNEKEKGS